MRRFYIVCLGIIAGLLGLENAYGAAWQGGFRAGLQHPHTELSDELGGVGYGFVRVGFRKRLQAELSAGFGRLEGGDYSTDLWMGDATLRLQLAQWDVIYPFVYVGGGLMRHRIHQLPALRTPDSDTAGWTATIPAGLGFQVGLSDRVRLEVSSGYLYTYRDDLNGAILIKGNDTFFDWTIGLAFGSFEVKEKTKTKPDKQIPIPRVVSRVDTDADGLTDVEERDFYQTNPQQPDSDGDGLTDFEETRRFFTNPNALDSDGDGLMDDEEVRVYQTNAHVSDTDGDGLPDGLEVSKYRTDPIKKDTDLGGVSDGDEVLAGLDPLASEDDVNRPALSFEPVFFESGAAELSDEAMRILKAAADVLKAYPNLRIEIQGHTDDADRDGVNKVLSDLRARTVRDYLTDQGVARSRLEIRAFGESAPIATNEDEGGRQQNRRVELHPISNGN